MFRFLLVFVLLLSYGNHLSADNLNPSVVGEYIQFSKPKSNSKKKSKDGSSQRSPKVEGLSQSTFVTEKHITSPTGLSVSPEGVVFVSCDINGITHVRGKAGKVVRCEDTDGDGVADKFSNFVEGIDSPRGSCYVDDILYLMQPPFLMAYQDLDKDGVAEKSSVLITQLGQALEIADVHHGPNGVRMGIDGWLYLAIGDQGCFKATGSDGSQATLYGGGVLRVRPDGSQLSVLVTGTRNIYDIAVDPYLDLFARDNTNDGGGWGTRFHHLIELADFGYPDRYKNFNHESMPSLADYGGGAGTGMYYLHEPGFPEGFGDALYSGDFNTGLSFHRRKRFEASYQIQQERFMNSLKNIDIDVDGSARMYCASWFGGGFGLSNKPFGHVDLIQPKDNLEAANYPDINNASDLELLVHLISPSQVARINSMREIVTRDRKSFFSDGLLRVARDTQVPLYARVAAVMTLKQIDGVKSHSALRSLYRDTHLREFIVRALGDVASEIDTQSKKLFLLALKDENPRVQLRAIVALTRSGDAQVARAILPLAKNEKIIVEKQQEENESADPEGWSEPHSVLSHIALQAVVKLEAVDLLLDKLNDPSLREAALRGLQMIHTETVVSGLARKVETTKDKQLAKLITHALFRLYHREAPWDGRTWWRNRPNFDGPYYKGVPWKHTPLVKATIELAFKKVDPSDYADLFKYLHLNQVPAAELNLDIAFDEVLSFLRKKTLSSEEFTQVMNAAADHNRPEKEVIQIYNYFKADDLPYSYINRVHILRIWGEGRAKGKLQRQAYAEFVSGDEFVGKIKELRPFFKNSEKESYKYAHLQLINIINKPGIPQKTLSDAIAELQKTWADKKNIYPHRLRGLMLAFQEVDPTPYTEKLKPLVEHRDERVKQAAARYLKMIQEAAAKKSK